MNFRKAENKDVKELAEIRWDFQYDPEDGKPEVSKNEFIIYCADFLKENLESGDWVCWVAEDSGKIISQIFIKKIRKMPKPNRLKDEYGYVTNVFTRSEFRNKGIGKVLMSKVKEWAIEEDLQLLIVWPSKKSINFYKNMGFTSENEIMELVLRED
jgi:GNAT superfamily N-acetyltransferase